MAILLSLFDYTGTWSDPFREVADVVCIDIKHGQDILTWDYTQLTDVVGILAAVPCTAYAGSGARWWKQKDESGETEYFNSLTRRTLEIVEYFQPKFWVIENPVGRIAKCVPELAKFKMLLFQPCEFGDPYTKKTVLYGHFNPHLVRHHVKPSEGSKMHLLPPSEDRAALRSETPKGFARAFYEAHKVYFPRTFA